MSDGRAADLNLLFFVPAGAAGVAHTGHNNSAHTAHSIVTNPVTCTYIHYNYYYVAMNEQVFDAQNLRRHFV